MQPLSSFKPATESLLNVLVFIVFIYLLCYVYVVLWKPAFAEIKH